MGKRSAEDNILININIKLSKDIITQRIIFSPNVFCGS